MKRFSLLFTLLAVLVLAGCADSMLSERDANSPSNSSRVQDDAPTEGKLRFPALMDRATATKTDAAGKYAAQNAHLFIAFAEYEADGVTRRVMDSYGVTRRILQEYGVTRRILEEYGVTRRILQEYGITRRIIDEYGGLTWELLEAQGITRRIMDEYGVTRRVLEDYADAYEPRIEVRVRINHVRPGVTIVFAYDILDTFLDEISDDPDVELIEPDVEFSGAPLYLREGFRHEAQMVPWNLDSVDGLFTDYDRDEVEIFLLDSGIYDRDLNVVEAKDFTMLFVNRHEETWDDSNVINMPLFDPGEMGDPVDRNGHGTHGAGTIGAKDNSEGIKGVAPEARIHSLKVLTDDGKTDITTVVSAIDYVTDFKQRNPTVPVVANMSLGMDLESTAYNILDEAVKRAIDFGVVVVVSAGNDYVDASTYSPAHVYEAITVGAYDQNDRFAAFSNYGPMVDILAPGDAVVSLTHLEAEADNDDNVLLSGTSSAAPHVTAAVALYLAQNPYASPAQVKQALINQADARIQDAPQGTTTRALNVGFADDGNTKAFKVTKSEWNTYRTQFKVEGEGPRLTTVELVNPGRGTVFSTMVIDEEGKWKFVAETMDAHPCEVDVVHAGSAERHVVLNAPGDCEDALEITTAEWKRGDNVVVVRGKAAPGTQIAISDARLDELITTVTAENDGKFEYESPEQDDAPCRVAVSNGYDTVESDVKDAHHDRCSGGMGLEIPVTIDKAEWDPGKFKLKVEGDGPESLLSFMSVASGVVYSTEASDGSFKNEIQNPSVLPCVVRVESAEGKYAEAAVIDRVTGGEPKNCEKPFALEEARWDDGAESLVLKGVGPFGAQVKFRSERTGNVVHTATISNDGKFDEELQSLQLIPCALVVEAPGETPFTFETAIEDAAQNCEVDLVFNLLSHIPQYDRLSAGGIATAGSTVTLTNPDNGTHIADVVVSAERAWRSDLSLELSEGLPCRVQAHAENGVSHISIVANASPCDPNFTFVAPEVPWEQNPYSFIRLNEASWLSATRQIRVKGEAYELMDIVVRHPYTGDVLGTMTNNDVPAFEFLVDVPGVIPCAIVAELDGRSVERAVANTPINCDETPVVTSVEWTGSNLLLNAVGGAGLGATFSSTARGPFAAATFDASGQVAMTLSSTSTPALDWIPCDVEVASNDIVHTLAVNNAPTYCDGTPDVLLAKWSNGQLMLTARGGFGAGLTVTSVGSGEQVTSASFDQNGMFSVGMPTSQLDYIPCSVLFETEGMTSSRPVEGAPAWCGGAMVVEQAKYNGGPFLFEAAGPFNAPFRVYSTEREDLVYAGNFGETGVVELELSAADGLPFVPSSLRIEHEPGVGRPQVESFHAVENVPDHADGVPVIGGAQWRNGSLELELSGPYGGTVQIFSAGLNRNIGSVSLDVEGFYDAPTATDIAPCTVRVETAYGTAEAAVANAPLFCDATAWLSFAKAEYRDNDQLLKLEGEGYDGFGSLNSTLTFHDAATGAQFHSTVTDDGEFEIEVENVTTSPCTIEARIAGGDGTTGTSVTLPVDGACGN